MKHQVCVADIGDEREVNIGQRAVVSDLQTERIRQGDLFDAVEYLNAVIKHLEIDAPTHFGLFEQFPRVLVCVRHEHADILKSLQPFEHFQGDICQGPNS